ncbi:MAG: glycosyl hydrolase [Flavobacteriaceae bacterium]
MIFRTLLFFLILGSAQSWAQTPSTSAQSIRESLNQKREMQKQSLVKNIRFNNIGPTIMSGRVVDLDVNPENTEEFYVAYASGGLWHTNNNGTSFIPAMDSTSTQNLGDIAVHWQSGTIWAGTGESNASRSSYAGIGIFKSTDMGENWQHMGLADSHHIGRILINPENPDEVVVGATGHLYSANEERGIYKTTDGGQNWKQVLYIDNQTGIIDLATAADNFNIQYASAWEKDRKAWNFRGNGENSGIYKSIDSGKTWKKMNIEGSGFPTGEGVGRIGLSVFDDNLLYAILDNQYRRDRRSPEVEEPGKLTKEDFKKMTATTLGQLSDDELDAYLRDENFPDKYTALVVKEMVRSGTIEPKDLSSYLDNANSLLFEVPVIGAEVYRSEDGGVSWTKMNEDYIDDLYYSYGYYFGQIRVDPSNQDRIYISGVPILKSENGGKTFQDISGENVHADHHALWINPNNPRHIINGNDGGVNITYDMGKHWIKNNAPTVGQFYAINVDYQEPYNVYGGLQDNGVWMGPHNAKENTRWHQTGHYAWKMILGGDGMQVQIDRSNPQLVYTGFQFGNYYRIDLDSGSRTKIQPRRDLGAEAFRFNWQTPILLSPHNQDILYLGSNLLHRSMDQGDTWESISGDLTQGDKKGNVAYGTITSISESPLKFGLVYVGTDDGLVQRTDDGGASWTNISGELPGSLWISEVVASRHSANRVYVSLNGYRQDDFTTYIYSSDDGGKSWTDISSNIPDAPVNALAEDTHSEDLLFAGTDNGLYVSFDKGKQWESFQTGIPNVAIHDLVIQDEAKHLLVGTHGRSIYQADISILQKLNESIRNSALTVFDLQTIEYSDDWGNPSTVWAEPNTPGLDISFFAGKPGNYGAKVRSLEGVVVSDTEVDAIRGLNILSYDMAFSKKGKSNYLKKYKRRLAAAKNGKSYLPPGKYEVEISGNGSMQVKQFVIKD